MSFVEFDVEFWMSNAEVILTARLIVFAGAGCFAVGLSVLLLGTSRMRLRPEPGDIWLYAPLVGAAMIILVCQNLLYIDVTSAQSAILVWLLTAAAWAAVLCSPSKRAMLVPLPGRRSFWERLSICSTSSDCLNSVPAILRFSCGLAGVPAYSCETQGSACGKVPRDLRLTCRRYAAMLPNLAVERRQPCLRTCIR
jgi:hypothetical protein